MEWLGDLIYVCPLLFIAGVIDAIAGGGGLMRAHLFDDGDACAYGIWCGKLQCSRAAPMARCVFGRMAY